MSDNSKIVSSIPFEDPFNVPENCIIDFSKTSFSEDFQENVNTAFIYLRNIDYSGNIDFSKLTYEQKSSVLKSYILRDIKDLSIKQLDNTIFRLFLSGSQDLDNSDYFTVDECQKFVDENKDLLDEIYHFIISIPVFIMSLDRSNTIEVKFGDIKHVDTIPSSYECILNLLKDKFSDAIIISDGGETKPYFYDKLFYYENGILADIVRNSEFSKIYTNILSISTCDAE